MKIALKKINNDVNLKIVKTSKFKFVNIQVSFMFNLDYEDIAAYNLLHNILTTRNNKYQTMKDFNLYLENNYGMSIRGNYFNRGNVGIFNVISNSMNSKYSLDDDLLIKQIETIKDCLLSPYLTNEVLDEVKMIYIEKLKEKLNKKTYILKKKINDKFGLSNPYGVNIEGDIDSISSVTLEKLKEVYNKLLNSDCTIYVCGDVEENKIEELFSNLNLKNSNQKILDLSYLKEIEKVDVQVYESNFLQSAISLIYECDINYNDELYYALKVFIEMFNYDLFNIIREKYNYCYYIYAISNNYLNTIEIVSEIESKNLDNVIKYIDEIIKGYETNFNEEQFEICKNKILTYIKTSLDSSRDVLELEFSFDFNRNVNSIEELENRYKSVNSNQIKEVSKMISLKMVSILKEASNNG